LEEQDQQSEEWSIAEGSEGTQKPAEFIHTPKRRLSAALSSVHIACSCFGVESCVLGRTRKPGTSHKE
jgi:hypothetical protein